MEKTEASTQERPRLDRKSWRQREGVEKQRISSCQGIVKSRDWVVARKYLVASFAKAVPTLPHTACWTE